MNEYQIEYSLFLVGTKDNESDEYILETWVDIDAESIDLAHAYMEKTFNRCMENLVNDEIQEEYDSISDIEDSALNILTINRISESSPVDKEVTHRDYTNEGPDDDGNYIKYHDTIWDTALASSDEDYEPTEVAVYDV